MEMPDGSIVHGTPGRVRGEVEERHKELSKYYRDISDEKTKRYKRQGNLESERPKPASYICSGADILMRSMQFATTLFAA